MSGNTVPALLVAAAASKPNAVAIRERTAGLWKEVTWAAYLDEASRFGMGLVALGVKAGDRVAILSENHPSWLVADVGAQGIGAAVLGIDPDTSSDHVATLLKFFGVTTVIVGDEEQFDKVTESRSRLAAVRTVVVVNTREEGNAASELRYEKTHSNIVEVKARDGIVISILTEGDGMSSKVSDHVIEIPAANDFLSPILSIVPLQLLAYYIAVRRGCDVDQPRNLAKSVTVE